jgi:hypothetical protein
VDRGGGGGLHALGMADGAHMDAAAGWEKWYGPAL